MRSQVLNPTMWNFVQLYIKFVVFYVGWFVNLYDLIISYMDVIIPVIKPPIFHMFIMPNSDIRGSM